MEGSGVLEGSALTSGSAFEKGSALEYSSQIADLTLETVKVTTDCLAAMTDEQQTRVPAHGSPKTAKLTMSKHERTFTVLDTLRALGDINDETSRLNKSLKILETCNQTQDVLCEARLDTLRNMLRVVHNNNYEQLDSLKLAEKMTHKYPLPLTTYEDPKTILAEEKNARQEALTAADQLQRQLNTLKDTIQTLIKQDERKLQTLSNHTHTHFVSAAHTFPTTVALSNAALSNAALSNACV